MALAVRARCYGMDHWQPRDRRFHFCERQIWMDRAAKSWPMDNLRNAKTELHFVAERQWTKKGGDRVHGSRSTPISGVRDRSQKMMLDGHYDVWGYMPSFQQTGNQRPLVGIEIGTKGQAMATAAELKFAFQELGINAKMAHQGNNNYEDDRVVVYVGIKP